MARKKRRFEQLEAAAATPQEKKKYNDPFQQQVGERLEDVGKKFEGKGKSILYGIGAIAVVAILVFLFLKWNRNSSGAAQTALGKAIATSQAEISETGPAAGSTDKTFKSEKERADAAIAEFQAVADKFGGAVGEKAKYFIAVNRLMSDRSAAITELEGLANGSSEVAKLSKFALAQTRAEDSRLDDAATIYQELAAMDNPVVAKDSINFELAKVYDKQDKKKEAADIYYNIAKAAADAKDQDGKSIQMPQTAVEAKQKLTRIDPDRANEIVEPTPELPTGQQGMPINIQPQ